MPLVHLRPPPPIDPSPPVDGVKAVLSTVSKRRFPAAAAGSETAPRLAPLSPYAVEVITLAARGFNLVVEGGQWACESLRRVLACKYKLHVAASAELIREMGRSSSTKLLTAFDVIIIEDDAGFLTADFLCGLDRKLRLAAGSPMPFAGVQIILIGLVSADVVRLVSADVVRHCFVTVPPESAPGDVFIPPLATVATWKRSPSQRRAVLAEKRRKAQLKRQKEAALEESLSIFTFTLRSAPPTYFAGGAIGQRIVPKWVEGSLRHSRGVWEELTRSRITGADWPLFERLCSTSLEGHKDEPTCPRCGLETSTHHILSACPSSAGLHRMLYRHNRVVLRLVAFLTSPEVRPQQGDVVWADLEGAPPLHATFPRWPDMAAVNPSESFHWQRPDILLERDGGRTLDIVEVACPFESMEMDSLYVTHCHKLKKFEPFKRLLVSSGTYETVNLVAVVVGARGFIPPQFFASLRNLVQPHPRRDTLIEELALDCADDAVSGSLRLVKEFSNPLWRPPSVPFPDTLRK